MVVKEDISLREYLHLLARRVKDPPCVDEYDAFLIQVWDFFALRVAAEGYFEKHKHVAISKRGALPIPWLLARETWKPGSPPEQTVTLIAKRNFNEINAIISSLRKVLTRVRQKVAIGRVQQVDAHCLRWLTRQPGRSAAEKGGVKQEILGVVRVENYNTLENRVFKDFLLRGLALATMYLRRYDKDPHRDHVNVKAVSRFKNLCVAGLALPEMEKVSELREFPQPNYVLQQDRLYSKVWGSYCDILRQEDVAEKLWNRRTEVNELYVKCNCQMDLHCSSRALFDTPLWVCELDGKGPILENPIWHNELGPEEVIDADIEKSGIRVGDAVVVDFTYPWDNRDELVYPTSHRNARPFIQNRRKPSLEPGRKVKVREILRAQDGGGLGDYFRQLYGLLGGKRWIVLVPDSWDSQWLEVVLRAKPPALSRDCVFLLWRSIAAVLGAMERQRFEANSIVVVADGFAVPTYNAVSIRFITDKETGRVLPQRASTRLHAGASTGEVRFVLERPFSDQAAAFSLGGRRAPRLGVGVLSQANFITPGQGVLYSARDAVLFDGVRRYLREETEGLVSYFDERDELSLVVQNRAEEVEFKVLVEHDECSPGGKPYHGKRERGASLLMGASKVSLNLIEGVREDNAPLKTLEVELEEKTSETYDIFFQAEMTPGQGLATVLFVADFLEKPLPLDLTKLKHSDLTKARIEREMKRHFPPVMPLVEASRDIWESVELQVLRYVGRGTLPSETGLFYKPQPYWGSVDPDAGGGYRHFGFDRFFDAETMSPVDLLKRENVFGNAPGHEYPVNDFDWEGLFSRLARDYKNGKNVLRMIAWTYQSGNLQFEYIRKDCYNRYVNRRESLTIVEYTFCANCFGLGDGRIPKMLRNALVRIASGAAAENEYRLAYNLLQFHPDSVEEIDSELCERAFMRIYREYNSYPFLDRYGGFTGTQAVKIAGYYLKCMLFLLHRRRYDSLFLQRSEDWKPSGFLGESLPTRTQTQEGHEKMRVSFLNYMRGHGTIEGIPLGD